MLRITVCMKQVFDPEAPSFSFSSSSSSFFFSSFRVDTEAKRVIPPKGVPPVLNPFDENALEGALKIKDTQDAEISVISMGRNLAKPVVRKALAAGADELILLEDDAFEDVDSYTTAYLLATATNRREV